MRKTNPLFLLLQKMKKRLLPVEKRLDDLRPTPYYILEVTGEEEMRHKVHDEHEMLRELILYIADRLSSHGKFGATKLNKILFYSDFVAYARLGKSITNERYWMLPKGPAPRFFVQVRRMMVDAEEIKPYTKITLSGRQQHRIAPLRPANLDKFSAEQISIVEQVIEILKDKDAEQVSDLSHEFIGCKIVKERQEIPYQTVFLRDPETITVTERHRKIADGIAKRDGL